MGNFLKKDLGPFKVGTYYEAGCVFSTVETGSCPDCGRPLLRVVTIEHPNGDASNPALCVQTKCSFWVNSHG